MADDGFEELLMSEAVRQSSTTPGTSSVGTDERGDRGLEQEPPVVLTLYSVAHVDAELKPGCGREGRLPGRLLLLSQSSTVFLNWAPSTQREPAATGAGMSGARSPVIRPNLYTVNYPLAELHSMHRKAGRLIVVHKSGVTLPPFVFEKTETLGHLLSFMRANLGLVVSRQDENTFLMAPPENLVRSLERLGLPASRQASATDDLSFNIFEASSRITRLFRQSLALLDGRGRQDHDVEIDGELERRLHKLPSDILEQDEAARRSAEAASTATEGAMQVRSMTDLGDLGAFNMLGSMSQAPPRRGCVRRDPVTLTQWQAWLAANDHIPSDGRALRAGIFAGGIEHPARKGIWKYLLGCSQRTEKEELYHTMKQQWSSVGPDQMTRFSALRETLVGIAKDVPRTDRDLSFYAGDENLDVMRNILSTYGMYNFDLGYVQGMSDLCSVVLHVVHDEVEAFWCFVGLMERMGKNFVMDQSGMHQHLRELACLIRFMDPELMDFLERHDAGNLYFAFRWLLVFFKREFSFQDTMTLWEVLWSDHYTTKFHLFVCLAILDMHRATIIQEHSCLDDLIGFVNSLSGTLDLSVVLVTAEALYLQFAESSGIPDMLADMVAAPASAEPRIITPGSDRSWIDVAEG